MDYFLAFSYFKKIGFSSVKKGIEFCGTIESFYNADRKILQRILKQTVVDEFVDFRTSFDIQKITEKLHEKNIITISYNDSQFPESLKNIGDPPLALFIKGNPECLLKGLNIAVVGTRKVSAYGRQVTTFFSSQLAKNGATIVSGMAFGVDTVAHEGCLEGGGKTIAVLGSGVDIIYPPRNRLLYHRILERGGAIVSELPPGCMPKPFTFVLRNRIIAGLSRGVLVVEGGLSSGSMITATYAIEQGRDVFAVPMPILSPMSAGPNSLLKQGGKLVLDPEDILSEYGISKNEQLNSITNTLNRNESLIYLSLQEEISDIATLIYKTRLPVQKLLPILSEMEIKGIILKNREGRYEAVISSRSVSAV